jgi:hypothetical protein
MAKSKTPKSRTAWTDHETTALLLGVKNHTEIEQIAKFLGRSAASVHHRLTSHHSEEWKASGHPQCHPWKSAGKARAAEQRATTRTENGVLEVAVEQVAPAPEPDTVQELGHDRCMAMIADLSARLLRLEKEWGVT